MIVTDYKTKLTADIFTLLKEKGFKRKGKNFSLQHNDLIYFIQIQSSSSSTSTVAKVTINIGIASLKLCELTEIEAPGYLDSHWINRLGFYLNPPTDKWWILSDSISYNMVREEIMDLLENRVLPDISSFQTSKDLEDFWLKGNYQGLTKKQQENYLQLLRG